MGAPEFGFVTERVGKALDGEARHKRVALEVKRAMNLDELHRALVAGEDRERGKPNVFAVHGICIGRLGWNRRRPVSARASEPSHDVFWLDARPHDRAKLGKLRTNVGELYGEGALRGVDFVGELDEFAFFTFEGGALLGAVRQAAIALWTTSRFDHCGFSSRRAVTRAGEALGVNLPRGCDSRADKGLWPRPLLISQLIRPGMPTPLAFPY